MAVQVQEVWSDIDPRIENDGLGGIKRVVNVAAVLGSIDNILRTRPGERVMLPEFGSRLASIVFENLDDTLMKFVSREVRNSIERWDDRVNVKTVKVTVDPNNSALSIALTFTIKGYGAQVFQHEVLIRGE